MKAVVLVALLAGAAAAADSKSRALEPLDLAACKPRLDARELLVVEFAGRRLKTTADLERLPAEGHRLFAYRVLQGLCSARANALQDLAKHFNDPVTLEVRAECREDGAGSHFDDNARRIVFRDTYACGADAMAVLYHEMAHAVNLDHMFRRGDVWETITLCLNESHDDSVFDADDGTPLNMMDAQTHAMRALDEGVADAVALAFEPKTRLLERPMAQFLLETRSEPWKRLSWARKQRNEYFVAAVLSRYFDRASPQNAERFMTLVRAASRAQPRTLEALLLALAEQDPVEARGRLDGVLRQLNAGWDSERAEAARARRGGR